MAISLASLRKGKHLSPPRIMIYGPHGLGKSSFGAAAPSPVFIPTEDGLGTIDTTAFPLCKSYAEFMECIYSLFQEQHEHRTVVIDSADWLEPLVWGEACRIHSKADIEEFGYGKGYIAAMDVWRQVLDGLNQLRDAKGMCVIFTAHTSIKRFDSPETEPYDRYQPKLHHGASALIQEWCDAVLFTNFKTIVQKEDVGFNQKAARGVTTGQRLIYTVERPAFYAKNRYNLPPELPLDWNSFQSAIAAAAAPAQEAQPTA